MEFGSTLVIAQTIQNLRAQGLRSAFRHETPHASDSQGILILAAIIVAMVSALLLVYHFQQKQSLTLPPGQPFRFFTRLLRRLGLRWADRVLLARIARHAGLVQPTVLLFDPDLLRKHAAAWLDTRPLELSRRRAMRQLERVLSVLFTTPAEQNPSTR